ncbi:anti-sigma factor [Bradyrhizobium sp. AUGA SZCCT0160]|uniref:anti-sigma factor family protein n=1 Tax=Bradyrhizobium sp. AUGA SZCCT0160 TaxID=2807662 RepID=UPI001BA4F070|nr:hypothetical protein [Bradyrhizobium sp. AUGA SZCCT0160]MBR1188539.1 hypothetical protein [Bradyrhizobium sp. AUGA SZCCT0160]
MSRPITGDDLHSYDDGLLNAVRRAEVADYLDAHPDVARQIDGYLNQRAMLSAALAPIAEEPLPTALNLSRILETKRRRRA